ncbi:carbohydrate ABC transporter permease [Saccharopolyspora sp. K220]|uniref:carbohydrate ABC transporter permease n=1 Tax=Saccharopolyspora soli TaxID=2926618 RepID=UPI001F567404|nr:carbohydrate ABC transporter permease [Saccharopolyspora soli]MCI2415836.1 carbohydrate ABC transporter permease [Saccharopolyspora soli]
MAVPTTAVAPGRSSARSAAARRRRVVRQPPNVLAGLGGFIWLAVIILPIYYVVISSLRTESGFFASNPLAPPTSISFDNYALVLHSGFGRYFLNSVIVTLASVVTTVTISLMAAYAVVRGEGRFVRSAFSVFLLGLAIPVHATIIPLYYMITRAHLYDSLLALVLPSIGFAVPITVLILANFIRDIPKELFESMRLDGATDRHMLWSLVVPLTRPALVTVGIYDALHVWNGFLFPLILTQSAEQRVLPMALWTFQGEFTVNVPAVLAAVVLSTLPMLAAYVLGRRYLVRGLTAGFSK